jgi:DNA mismatch repair protein MutS
MMKQYVEAKSAYPDALLFFRMGDFYEMFFEDAEMGGKYLGLTVTSRNKESSVPEPMSGFPHHQLPSYLSKALSFGLKVAVCEQLEDPTLAKGLVKRGITRVVTPGVVLDEASLDARTSNYLAAISPDDESGSVGIACLDVSTGSFRVTEVHGTAILQAEISRMEPRELLIPSDFDLTRLGSLPDRMRLTITRDDKNRFKSDSSRKHLRLLTYDDLESQLDAEQAIVSYGFGQPELAIETVCAVCDYVIETQGALPMHARTVSLYRIDDTLILDETAKRNLELFRTLIDGRKKGSLLGVLDRAATAMGGRRLKHWMAFPLISPERINTRLDAVEWLSAHPTERARLRAILGNVYDLERLNGRAAAGNASPRDLWFMRLSLEAMPELRQELDQIGPLQALLQGLGDTSEVLEILSTTLADDPPPVLKDGGVIRPGFNAELDEWTALATQSQAFLLALEIQEREATGIQTLKVKFNRVFGYFIEVRRTQTSQVPEHYIRKQTLTNAERYITEELKAFEEKVVNAQSRRTALESELFNTFRLDVGAHADRLAQTAKTLADLDVLTTFGEIAHRNEYVRPVVNAGDRLAFVNCRHPVVEDAVGREEFVPNSVTLDAQTQDLIILTGPNMAGKSTTMRQVALCTLMAQMGSFVPADSAEVGVVDRIFTRVGAADDLAAGRSTFMVEMHETATILAEATKKSLLILDEIGRGTSTFDGVSIAWSVAEYIHDVIGAKTIFATHYHELTQLEAFKPRVLNQSIAVKEWNDEVLFLRQLVNGSASRSYGIQVGRLAGLPDVVVERAKVVLSQLDGMPSPEAKDDGPKVGFDGDRKMQMSLFSPPPVPSAPNRIEQDLRSARIDEMTPLQALNFLHALRTKLPKR